MRWMLMRARRSGFNSRHLLIVGHNEHAMHMAERIQRSPELGYRIVGFIAEEKDAEKPGTGAGKVIGSFSELQSILEKGTVDEVMICLSVSTQFPLVARAVQLARDLGVVVRVYPESSEARLLTDFSIERFEGDCILTLFRERLLFQLFFKRIIDVIVSFVALIVLAPLLVTVALCIKATSPGPVLFVQERVGMNRRKFKLYKFRSMYIDAERRKAEFAHLNEMDGPVFKIKNDPRITPLGRFIRKTSIDELPQLMNVLFGQMSLVGPRPPLPSEVDQYEWLYRKRLSIKPGLTCLWQISGRNTVSFKRWMEMDKEYIERWSIWLDLEILAKTVPVVLFGRGAS
jgi:exopolysaccharide biosynthesis polyprenyl glycosylphosphotransferase